MHPQHKRAAEEIACRASNALKESVVYKYIPVLEVVTFTTYNSSISTNLPLESITEERAAELAIFVTTRIREMRDHVQLTIQKAN